MKAAAKAAAAAVVILLASQAAVTLVAGQSTPETFGWWTRKSRNFYWNGCKHPCTTNPPKWQYPQPYPPKPDPVRPTVLSCQPGYGYVSSLTGTPYAGLSGYNGGAMCIPCESGFYSPGGRSRAHLSPVPFPVLSVVDAIQGHGLSGNGVCALCPLGSFWPGPAKTAVDVGTSIAAAAAAKGKKKATLSSCLQCDEPNEDAGGFTTLQRGATSVNQCVCDPGFGGKLCNICPIGTWSPGGTTADCIACGGVGTTETEGSTTSSACGCQAGSGGVNCDRCPENTWSTGGNRVECSPCPINTVAPPGSVEFQACVPKPGFGLVNGIIVPGTGIRDGAAQQHHLC
eukprot:gene9495-9658_t